MRISAVVIPWELEIIVHDVTVIDQIVADIHFVHVHAHTVYVFGTIYN